MGVLRSPYLSGYLCAVAKKTASRVALVTLVFAYYENPEMLALQYKEISHYPLEIKNALNVIVVDDASPVHPAFAVTRPQSLPPLSLFRISHDVRWNQDAARNIGAHEASTQWLLLTDIDHVVPAATLENVIAMEKQPGNFYTFGRIKYDNQQVREPHPNSYFMTKELYWNIGGHDEDFAGIYGKDFLFRKRAKKLAEEVSLESWPLARVGSTFVSDAGTSTITRRNSLGARAWGYLLEGLKRAKLWRGVQVLTHAYTREI